jgi:hypothetical protein
MFFYQLPRDGIPDDVAPEADHLHIVVLGSLVGWIILVDQRGPHARHPRHPTVST